MSWVHVDPTLLRRDISRFRAEHNVSNNLNTSLYLIISSLIFILYMASIKLVTLAIRVSISSFLVIILNAHEAHKTVAKPISNRLKQEASQ